jgi:pimeloyl-ACP methyl ester carboxylesterase
MYSSNTPGHVPVRRAFAYVGDSEIHYRHAGPPDAPVVLCLHASPVSSLALVPLISALGRSFRVIAPDTLGNGDSSGPMPEQPEVGFYAGVVADFLDAIGVRDCAVYGTHTGASIAMELARSGRVRIDRLILDGVGLYTPEFQERVLRDYIPDIKPDESGAYLVRLWSMLRDMYLFWPWFDRRAASRRPIDMPPPQVMHQRFVEVLKSWNTFGRSYKAAFAFDKRTALAALTQPVLVTTVAGDMLSTFDAEICGLLARPTARSNPGYATPDAAAATADLFQSFLAGELDALPPTPPPTRKP